MILSNLREIVKTMTLDVRQSQAISDTEYDSLIRRAIMALATLLKNNDYQYYKYQTTYSISSSGLSEFTFSSTPIYEKANGISYALFKNEDDEYITITPTTIEALYAALAAEGEVSYISMVNEKLYVYISSTDGSSGTLTVVAFGSPDFAATDEADVNVPAEYIDYIVNLVKKYCYQRLNIEVPKWLDQKIYDIEMETAA
jgi:hypothetical protein